MKSLNWFKRTRAAKDSQSGITLLHLWREFLPLSLSDITMACGDPLMTTTLAHLPEARMNIAAVGIGRTLAIFFESPIIMILHASNALAPTQASRRALWRFVLFAGGSLSFLLMVLALPIVFNLVGSSLLGIPATLAPTVQQVLILVGLWPFAIAWRRYFQGLLIFHGHGGAMAQASLWRLGTVVGILSLGWLQVGIPGAVLAGLSLVLGVIVEAIVVTWFAKRLNILTVLPGNETEVSLPQNLPQVWKFYWPLANSMMVAWGGRTLLVGLIARSYDANLALAAWPAAWGMVVVISNSTRMVQQMIIKYRHKLSDRRLLKFTLSVGGTCSLVLLLMATTPWGNLLIQGFIGSDPELIDRIRPVLLVCTLQPLFVAILNAAQGFLVSDGRTGSVNLATWLGTGALLLVAWVGVSSGLGGAMVGAIAMLSSMVVEIGFLLIQHRLRCSN